MKKLPLIKVEMGGKRTLGRRKKLFLDLFLGPLFSRFLTYEIEIRIRKNRKNF